MIETSIMPIVPGKLQLCISTIDDWIRNQRRAMDEYCHRVGICQWNVWIQEMAEKNYIVQCHGFEAGCNTHTLHQRYQHEQSQFVQQVRQLGVQCYGVDWSNEEQWKKLEK